jgi:hypothetical protein
MPLRIHDCKFGPRLKNALEARGIAYRQSLELYTDAELLSWDGIGKIALAKIRRVAPFRIPRSETFGQVIRRIVREELSNIR